jgi:hypothetical protein
MVYWLARDCGYSAIPAAGLIEQNRSAIRQLPAVQPKITLKDSFSIR